MDGIIHYGTKQRERERAREKNKYHCAKTKITKNAIRNREYVVGDIRNAWKTNFMRFREFEQGNRSKG